MRLLHVTPHLGGGVGKAHAALSSVIRKDAVEQTFVLLEPPCDRRYADAIEAAGARVLVADDLAHVARLAAEADIVQFEFWNHPRLLECLARCKFPAMRSIFWSHISGLHKPLIPPGLMEEAMRFVFTTEASFDIASVGLISEAGKGRVAVVNSGFGFPNAPPRATRSGKSTIAYLGTVDFVKMHPGFFDVIDGLTGDIRVSIWGEPSSEVVGRAQAMRHAERIHFCGRTSDPAAALSECDVFFYPLQPDHYGTAENALIEAMSLGLAPVVMNNPAERAIIRDGETGFVARTLEQAVSRLEMLLTSPTEIGRVGRNAAADVVATRTAEQSVSDFMILWLGMLGKAPRKCDFRRAIGGTPAEWFIATQGLPVDWKFSGNIQPPSKGTMAHFESVFIGDPTLARLRLSI